MPLNALILTTALVVIFGCIFLGSSRSAQNALNNYSFRSLLPQRLQRYHFGLCRSSWCLLRHPTSHQLSPRAQNATSQAFRIAWTAGMVL